jgi:hypothetical protein
MVLYYCVLIVFTLRREWLKLILAMDPLPRWFCHILQSERGAKQRHDSLVVPLDQSTKLGRPQNKSTTVTVAKVNDGVFLELRMG